MIVLIQWAIALLLIPVMQRESADEIRMISTNEREALVALYEATGGNAWIQHHGWLGPIGTECRWYGVTCAREASEQTSDKWTVTDLHLRRNGLKGSLPTEVSALKNLKRLMLEGNAVKGPIPNALLQRFDQAQLDIEPLSLIHDVEEILVEVQNPALLCFGLRAWISADGNVRRERKMCREKNGQVTRDVYFEYQQGKTHDFDRLARSLVRSGFFSDTPSSTNLWVDVVETTVTAKRIGGVSKRRSWSNSLSMSEWDLEMQMYGVLAEVEWVGLPTMKK
jgi:hypothetical protein